MKTESKTTILRNLKSQWTKDLGSNKLDVINQEILKLSMKSGPLTEKDIAFSQKKLCVSPKRKARGTVATGTSSAQGERGVEAEKLLMGKHKSLRSSGVDQITKLQDEIAANPMSIGTRNNTQVFSKQHSLEKGI